MDDTEINVAPSEDALTAPEIGMSPDQALALLKQKADTLGLKYSNNIKAETLRQKINEAMDDKAGETRNMPNDGDNSVAIKSIAQIHQEEREKQAKEQMKLIRCRIYNLNPSKSDLRGEIVTVANRFVGTVRKMIPFGEQTDGGYHIPYILYKELKGRKFQQIRTKTVNGQIVIESRDVPEYNIEVLEALTEEELLELRMNQEAARRVGNQ